MVVVGALTPTATPARAATADTAATYVPVARHSGKAVRVRSAADGARISRYDANPGTDRQWQIVRPGTSAPAGNGSPTDPNVKFFGRWNTADPAAHVSEWAGAYLVVGFTGRTVKLKQRNAIDFYASIDGGPDVSYVNRSGTVDLTPTPLAAGNHTLRVSYRPIAGSYRGDAVYRGIQLDAGAGTFAPPVPAKLVEFVGDSITVGQQSSKQALTAYGWLAGERLGAAHTQIAVGGACLVPAADGCIGMSDRFLRTGLQDNAANWDFSRYRADAVVINLGTNDVGHGVTGAQFQSAYVTLIRRAREKYPNATILALQTFRKRFIAETQAAVRAVNDPKVSFVDTTGWIVEATDTTDNVHPNDQGHRKIADRLAPLLSSALNTTG
ncbi:endoglucanase [Saccharothrix syringae]|uniref:Endoglucanase n=2 Tax=Saccharothrix syringae TaxID=103733 RepID=A0A5Q0HE82_SACSY|nr:endoglucanase [Saccharothrix syringae]